MKQRRKNWPNWVKKSWKSVKISMSLKRLPTICWRVWRKMGKDLQLKVPQHNINKIQNLAISATEYLTTVVGAGVSGAAAGFAVYSGVMAFAAASTGTPIAALSWRITPQWQRLVVVLRRWGWGWRAARWCLAVQWWLR
jgi:hypothetical protein